MRPFTYHAATTVDDAARRLATPGAMPLGGGTDLLVTVKEGLARPDALVDLRRAGGEAAAREIRELPGGGLRLGAATRIADVAAHATVRERFPALAEAAASVGTYALRAMGTIGGNLCQRPRCWYFRRGIPCLKNGGDSCPARDGENQYHAILGGGPCWIVHPSDPAVALTALDASVEIVSAAGGTRRLPIAEFYVLPAERLDRETVLADGEFVSAVEIPAAAAGGVQRWFKVMQRGAWDFALVSLAAVRRTDGEVRLVLGGVAPRPYRLYGSIEEDVSVGNLDEADVETLAARALYDAEPLAKNGYKVHVAESLLRRAIRELWRDDADAGAPP
ncbi:MAG TPA: xanthine dehydrogenase family protein subunit M [Gemmatimonadaceae bacterium]|nr:xanthine dehydrogenase family protein subunit M [Gemmatimonadaceae bacterium]